MYDVIINSKLMVISEAIKAQIRELSLVSEVEQCGIVIKNRATLLTNIHPEPDNNFTICPVDLNYFEWDDIQAIWHTHHKDTQPGYFTYPDIQLSHQSQKPIILYHTGFDFWDYYEPNNPDAFPLEKKEYSPDQLEFYLNVKFHWGRSDCFAIVRRCLMGIVKIDIGEFTRPDITDFPPEDYDCPWSMDKFELLPLGTQPQLYDVFGIALKGGKKVNHAMLMVKPEENMIFHSLTVNSLSRLEQYGDFWRRRTLLHGRLRELC